MNNREAEETEGKTELFLERLFSRGRWLLLPFFVALILILLPLMFHIVREFSAVAVMVGKEFGLCSDLKNPSAKERADEIVKARKDAEAELEVKVLTLIDTSLIACLLVIVSFCGYHSFVSNLDSSLNERGIRKWMAKVGFSDLKLKLMSAIVAISGIELLKSFLQINFNEGTAQEHPISTHKDLAWRVGIHLTFAVSVLLFSISDRIAEKKPGAEDESNGLASARITSGLVEASRVIRTYHETDAVVIRDVSETLPSDPA